MASITIPDNLENRIFADLVQQETGVELESTGLWITIENEAELVIPFYCLKQAINPENNKDLLGVWHSLLLNREGFLLKFDRDEIVIIDVKPSSNIRPQFLFRFPTEEIKQETEDLAKKLEYESVGAYIVEAIIAFNTGYLDVLRST